MTVRRFAGKGVTIVADAYGDPADVPVLMLHGGAQSRSAWRGAARQLATRGYHALAIDMRGHGDSDWASDGDYAFARYADDLVAIICELGRPAVLVGASHGGLSALVAAAAHPEAVRALALADVTPWLDEEHADTMRAVLRKSAAGYADVDEAAAMVNGLQGSPPRADNSGLKAHMREGDDGRLYWRWDPRFVEDRFVRHGGEGGMLVAAARRLPMPVLLMHAEHSNVVEEAHVEAFKAALPALLTERIMGLRHMVTGDDNVAYLPALIDFLDAIDAVSGSR